MYCRQNTTEKSSLERIISKFECTAEPLRSDDPFFDINPQFTASPEIQIECDDSEPPLEYLEQQAMEYAEEFRDEDIGPFVQIGQKKVRQYPSPQGCYDYYEDPLPKLPATTDVTPRDKVKAYQIHEVPDHLFTNRQLKKYDLQKKRGAKPQGVLLFGDKMIPLYDSADTRPYLPSRFTVAMSKLEQKLLRFQKKKTHGVFKENWKQEPGGIDPRMFKDHLLERQIYGVTGHKMTYWFAIDIDLHESDSKEEFVRQMRAIEGIFDKFTDARFCFSTNKRTIRGIHIYAFFDQPQNLQSLIWRVRKELDVIAKHTGVESLKRLEVYPVNKNFRLPFGKGRICFADDIYFEYPDLELIPDTEEYDRRYAKRKARDLIRLSNYLEEGGEAIPFYQFRDFVFSQIQILPNRPAVTPVPNQPIAKSAKSSTSTFKNNMFPTLLGLIDGSYAPEPDSLNVWVCTAMRCLIMVDKLSLDGALKVLESYLRQIPDKSFSDRLSAGNYQEVLRVAKTLGKKILRGNLGQSDPEKSTKIFDGIRDFCESRGFWFSDPSTWGNYYRNPKFEPNDFEEHDLTFDEKLKVKGITKLLKCPIKQAYQVAARVIGYVESNKETELAAIHIPKICDGIDVIEWLTWSEESSGRSKKAERLMRALCESGLIHVHTKSKYHPKRKTATSYTVAAPSSELPSHLYSALLGLPITKQHRVGITPLPPGGNLLLWPTPLAKSQPHRKNHNQIADTSGPDPPNSG
jgi:hypothetical protein